MTTIKANFGEGGANLVPKGTTTEPSLAATLRDIADDLAATRTAILALTAKLDGEGTLGGGYATAVDPDAFKTIKG